MSAFVPLTEYPGGGFKDLSKEGFVLAETKGVFFFNEIAPNVCRVTRIQTVDLKFSGIHKTVTDNAIDYLAKNQLVEANRLQEKFRRNGKMVDAEVRGALVERMREGVELEEDQVKAFKVITAATPASVPTARPISAAGGRVRVDEVVMGAASKMQ